MSIPLENHNQLVRWIRSLGGRLSDRVELARDDKKGFYIRVKADEIVHSHSIIVRCPIDATISVLNAFDAPSFPCRGTKFPQAFLKLGTFTVQCFFFLDQYLYGSKSYWYPFFRTLPTPQELGSHAPFQETDLEWLEGTNLARGLERQLQDWRTAFHSGMNKLSSLNWQRACTNAYTWSDYLPGTIASANRGKQGAICLRGGRLLHTKLFFRCVNEHPRRRDCTSLRPRTRRP